MLSPFVMKGNTSLSTLNDLAAGAVLIALSFPKGPIRERYGTFNRMII